MARKANARLHLLDTLDVINAGDGDATDGGGLLLRVRGESASWVLRYTAANGKRREMGLGVAHRGSQKQAGASLTEARELAEDARRLLRKKVDPIDDRQRQRDEARAIDEQARTARRREQRTLARVARDYHERVIEPSRTRSALRSGSRRWRPTYPPTCGPSPSTARQASRVKCALDIER